MSKPGIKIRETDGFVDGQGAEQRVLQDRQAARAANRASYQGKVFADLSGPQKDVLLRDIAIELGLISK